jgi:predicted ferric reductase
MKVFPEKLIEPSQTIIMQVAPSEGEDQGDRREGCRQVNKGFHKKNFGGVREVTKMLWTIFVILLVLWALGLLTGYTVGGIIHALLVIAIIVVVIQVIQGRRRV